MRTSVVRALLAILVALVAAPAWAKPAPVAPVPLEEYFKIRRVGSRSGILLSFSSRREARRLPERRGRPHRGLGATDRRRHAAPDHARQGLHPGRSRSRRRRRRARLHQRTPAATSCRTCYLTDSKGTAPRDLVRRSCRPARRTDFVEWADDGKTLPLPVERARREATSTSTSTTSPPRRASGCGRPRASSTLASVSRDHKRFIIGETLSDADSNLYLVERGAKDKPTLLTPHKGEVAFDPAGHLAGRQDAATTRPTRAASSPRSSRWICKTHASKPVAAAGVGRRGRGLLARLEVLLPRRSTPTGSSQLEVTRRGHGASRWRCRRRRRAARGCRSPRRAPIAISRVRLQSDAAPATPYVIDLSAGTARQRRRSAAADPARSQDDRRRDRAHPVVRRQQGAGVPLQARRRRAVPRDHRRARRPDGAVAPRVQPHPPVPGLEGLRRCWCRTCAARPATARRTRKLDNHDLGGGPLKDVVACKKWLVKERARRRRQGRRDGRQLRRLHGARRGDVHAERVRGQRRLLRRLGSEDARRELPALLGRRPPSPSTRSSATPRIPADAQVPARSLAAPLRRQDRAAAARRAGRPRRAREEGPVGSRRRRAAEAQGAGALPGARRRGPRLLAQREPAGRLSRRPIASSIATSSATAPSTSCRRRSRPVPSSRGEERCAIGPSGCKIVAWHVWGH